MWAMTAKELLAEQMRLLSLKRTKESRVRGGSKAWQTRIKNMDAKLANTISGGAGKEAKQ